MKSTSNQQNNILSTTLIIIVIGSIWGFLEMVLGGFLHTIHFAQQGTVMGGLAISLMAIFLTITKKPVLVPLLGVIAASFKPFSAVIFGQPVFSAYVVNPAIAIALEAVAFGAVAFVLQKAMARHLPNKFGAGFLAGALGIVLYAVTASVFGLGKWPHLDMAARIKTVIDTGLPVAFAGAVMLVAGNLAGKFSRPSFSTFRGQYPKFYYGATMALIISCWAIPPVFHLGG